jgi:hypothetical protein
LSNVHGVPPSYPVLLAPTTWPVVVSITGEPDVPGIVSQPGWWYWIDWSQVQLASRSW